MDPSPAQNQGTIDWQPLVESASSWGVTVTPHQLGAFDQYVELLTNWNRRFNLTALEQPSAIRTRHFLDSLSCLRLAPVRTADSILDVGTGAGFPGLVLKLMRPEVKVVLLDSLQKRLRFLDTVITELSLTEIWLVHARAEDAAAFRPVVAVEGPPLRQRFEVVTARAVAPLAVLAEWTLPFARVGGHVVAMKGPDVEAEVEEATAAIASLGGELEEVQKLELQGDGDPVGRSLVLIKKVRNTPKNLPRPPGSARAQPLGSPNRPRRA